MGPWWWKEVVNWQLGEANLSGWEYKLVEQQRDRDRWAFGRGESTLYTDFRPEPDQLLASERRYLMLRDVIYNKRLLQGSWEELEAPRWLGVRYIDTEYDQTGRHASFMLKLE